MDTNRLMSSYSIPVHENADDSLEGCFYQASKNLPSSSPLFSPKGPYRSTDDNRALQHRLAIHNRHFIPIGFYYSKWLEKLRFHLDNREEERRSSSSSSGSSRSSQRSQVSRSDSKAEAEHQSSRKRPKVNEVKASSVTQISRPPPTTELQKRGKDCLSHEDHVRRQRAEREANKMASSSAAATRKATHKELLEKRAAILDGRASTKLSIQDKAVFHYREERQLQFFHVGHGMEEEASNAQYDSDQFFLVQKLLEEGNNNNNEGHGSAKQGRR
jgi:hypothetical protein